MLEINSNNLKENLNMNNVKDVTNNWTSIIEKVGMIIFEYINAIQIKVGINKIRSIKYE